MTGRAEACAATAHYLSSLNDACHAGDSERKIASRLEQGIRPRMRAQLEPVRQEDAKEDAEEEAVGAADVDTGEHMPWYD